MHCAIYIRKSREKDEGKQAFRLDYQREVLPVYAEAQGWQYDVYDDAYASGADMDALPELMRLIQNIQAGTIQVVLCIEFSRLSRDESLQQFTAFLELCVQHQVSIATEHALRKPWLPIEWQMCILEGSFSAVEMKIIKMRMHEGRQRALKEGKWLGGPAPYGWYYDRNDRQLHVDQEEAKMLKDILRWSLTESTRQIERRLENIRSRNGGDFTRSLIRRLVTEKRLLFYSGYRRLNGQLIQGQWEPLIDQEMMEKIQYRKKARNFRGGETDTRPKYLLTGLNIFTCAYCGSSIKSQRASKMRRRRDGSEYEHLVEMYGCKTIACRKRHDLKYFKMELIENAISRDIRKTLLKLDVIEKGFQALEAMKDTRFQPQLKKIRETLKGKFRAKENLINAIQKGIIVEDDVRIRMEKLTGDIALIEHKIEDILSQIHGTTSQDLKHIRHFANLAVKNFPLMPKENKRELILNCIDQIKLYRKDIHIVYRFPITKIGGHIKRIQLQK